MDISVVIVSWNTKDDLRAAIESCYQHSDELQIEVIVVDNGSTDGSVKMVNGTFPRAQVIANGENVGYTAACNQGMAAASARYYLMLNSDAQLTEGCLQELVRVMDENYDIGSASPRLRFPDGGKQYAAGIFPRLSVRILPVGLIRRIELAATDRFELPGDFFEVDYVFGACNMVRPSVVEQVGMMDERIFMWCDDADWAKRMADAGYKRVIVNGAVCVHKVGASYQLVPKIRQNLQRSMSEFAYFRIHHGRAATFLLYAVRTIYSLVKVLIISPFALFTAGRNRRVADALLMAWCRFTFHITHARDILWREPKPYRPDEWR